MKPEPQKKENNENKDEAKSKDGHEYAFDVDISFAGAFICAEGPLASIVCRRLLRYIKSEKVCDTQFEKFTPTWRLYN